jgi:hypothetical protein
MTLPIWTANTAVLAGYLVSKTTPDGTAWYATQNGTTGGTEPTWPTAQPWTVTDNTTVWGLTTSFRTNAMDAIYSTLVAFRNANTNLLKGVGKARPKSLTNFDLPGVYIAGSDESILYPGTQMQTRNLTGLSVMVVDVTPDNIEAEDRMDVLVDGLVGLFARSFHAIDGRSILQMTTITEVPFDEGGIPYLATLISLGGTFKTEGSQAA